MPPGGEGGVYFFGGGEGKYDDASLSAGVIEYAKRREGGRQLDLPEGRADQVYARWREQLGYTGESWGAGCNTSFEWKKKAAAAAAAFVRGLDVWCPQGEQLSRCGAQLSPAQTPLRGSPMVVPWLSHGCPMADPWLAHDWPMTGP